LFGKHHLNPHPWPSGASEEALKAREPRCVNLIGYVGPTRSASFRTEVNNALTWFGLCGGSSAKPWCDRLVADVAAYHSDIKAGKRDQLRATGLP
jgi:CDGSH-type Zn-finger protein